MAISSDNELEKSTKFIDGFVRRRSKSNRWAITLVGPNLQCECYLETLIINLTQTVGFNSSICNKLNGNSYVYNDVSCMYEEPNYGNKSNRSLTIIPWMK